MLSLKACHLFLSKTMVGLVIVHGYLYPSNHKCVYRESAASYRMRECKKRETT